MGAAHQGTPAPHLHVSLVQSELQQGKTAHNLGHLEELLIGVPAADGPHLILLPELFPIGYSADAWRQAEAPNGNSWRWLQLQANRLQAVVAGSMPIRMKDQCYNQLVVMWPGGKAQTYDKAYLFSPGGEAAGMTSGTAPVHITVAGWRIRCSICYDVRFPEAVRTEKQAPYDLLINVANWPTQRQTAWHTLLAARALENAAYVAGVNRTGVDGVTGTTYTGGSTVFTAEGQALATAHAEEGILSARLDYAALHEYRRRFNMLGDIKV